MTLTVASSTVASTMASTVASSTGHLAMAVELDQNAMQQLQAEQRALLDTIDELRTLGLGKFLDLPQIVVVGDQSAGKSSVLEAISRVRFPIKDGVCTRFATELVLRQSPETKVDVRVQSDSPDLDHAFNRTGFTKDDLPAIVEEAKQHMGITADSTQFSEHVLRVEISGPDVPQLTLVDLPGFFHNETESQGIGGVAIVDRLAESYMRQENSIILAVISAQNELAAQKVLGEAKKHDPKRERTLGIITKPDRLDEDSINEQMYLRLAQNDEASHKLALGWHVLRNRAARETTCTDEDRDKEEKRFFNSGVWSAISSHDCGVDMLRDKLSQVLLGHIQRKLPGLVAKIEDHINNRQTRLKKLGDQRSSTEDVKKYLINISSRYQRVARDAVQGSYADEFFGGLYPGADSSYEDRRIRKLRALIRDLNRAFYFLLKTRGARRHILWEDNTAGQNEVADTAPPEYLEPLVGLYTLGDRVEITIKDLTDELDRMASENQGVEFPGSSNDRIALNLFRDQSQSWEGLANQHVDLVTHFTRAFAEKVVSHVVGPDAKTAEAVVKNLVTPYFDQKHAVLKAKVVELLQHYKRGYDPQPTMYDDFIDRVTDRRDNRLVKHLAAARIEDANPHAERSREALLDVLKSSKVNEFNAEHTIDNAITYYEMSLRVFTDNVVILALENCLISDIPNILSPDKVYAMSDDTVKALAAESKQIQRERKELQSQLDKLRKGLVACRGYGPSQFSGTSSTLPHFSIPEPRPSRAPMATGSRHSASAVSPSPTPQRQTATVPAPTQPPSSSAGPGIPARPAPSRPGNTAAPATPSVITGGLTPAQPATANNLFAHLAPPPYSAQATNASGTPLRATGERLFGQGFFSTPATAAVPSNGSPFALAAAAAPRTGSIFASTTPGNPATAAAPTTGSLFSSAAAGTRATGSLFASTNLGNPVTAAAPATGSLFSSAAAAAPATGSLFGSTNSGNPATAASSLFASRASNVAPGGNSLFGGPGRPS
ncbi:P-loop containing nucleoside triphosphate hydrolase protein [Podospora conica]|nr:P-loop containing nucleoside triphosphate hydrolase protein [Schizothecium conicum]